MIPRLIIFRNKANLDRYIQLEIKNFHINPSHIIKIEPPKGKEITINQIREVKKIFKYQKKELSLIIFYDFDQANIEAQNALLKTLEEEITNNLIILTAKNLHILLPAITSRTKIIYLNDSVTNFIYKKTDVEVVKKFLFDFNLTSHFANPFFEIVTKDRAIDLFLIIIDIMRNFFYKIQSENEKKITFMPKIIKEGINLINLIQNNNINPQLALDNYLILVKKEIMINKDAKNRG